MPQLLQKEVKPSCCAGGRAAPTPHVPAACQTSNILFPAAASLHLAERSPSPLQTQRSALFPSYALQQSPTHPRLITLSLLDALGTHYSHQSTAVQCKAFQDMLNSFSQRVVSQTSDPAAGKCPADKKGCLTSKMEWIRDLPHVHHQSGTTECYHKYPFSSLPQTKMNQLLLFLGKFFFFPSEWSHERVWIQALTADPPNKQAKDRRNHSAKAGSHKLCLKVGRKGSKKSSLPLISSPRLALLVRRRLELGLDTDLNVSLLIQSLSEHPELSALQILSWKKQNELSGENSCSFLPVVGPEILQR